MSKINRLALMGGCVLALALTACFPGRERFEQPERDEPPPAHRVRILDGAGELQGSMQLRRRSAVISDALGIRVGRATVIQERVVVRDRRGRVRCVLRPDSNDLEEGASDHATVIEDGDGRIVGRLSVEGQNVRLSGPGGFQRGETIVRAEHDDEVLVEVFGAPGTDLALMVAPAANREVWVTDPWGQNVMRLSGYALPLWIVAAMALEAPELPVLEADEGVDAGEGTDTDRFFQVGLLVYLRQLDVDATEGMD